jgi:hypothetical protein
MLYSKRRKNLRGGRYKKHSKIKSNKRHHMIGGNRLTEEYSEKFPEEVKKIIKNRHEVDIVIEDKNSMIEYLKSEGSKDIDLIYSALGFTPDLYKVKLPCNIEHTALLAAVLDTMVKFNLKSLEEDLGPAMLYIYGEIKKNPDINIDAPMYESIYNMNFPSNYTTYTKKEMSNLFEQFVKTCKTVLESCNQTFHLQILLLSMFFEMKEKYYRLKYLEKFPEEVKKIIEQHHKVKNSYNIEFRDELTLKEYFDDKGYEDINLIYRVLEFPPFFYKMKLPFNIEHTAFLAALLDTMVKFNLKSLKEDFKPAMLNIYEEIKENLTVDERMHESIYNMYFPSNYGKDKMLQLQELQKLQDEFIKTYETVIKLCNPKFHLQMFLLGLFFERSI